MNPPDVLIAIIRPHQHGWEWRVDYENEGCIGGVVASRETALAMVDDWTSHKIGGKYESR